MKDNLLRIFNLLMLPLGILYSERLIRYAQLLSIICYSALVRNRFARCGRLMARGWNLRIIGGKYISLGNRVYIDAYTRLEACDKFLGESYHPHITIGDNVVINLFCHIGCINEVRIGNCVTIAARSTIMDHHHGEATAEDIRLAPRERKLHSRGPVIIEDAVAIGENCFIMPGVTIGHHSMIGANSVVTRSVPPYSVVTGTPARIIKTLQP